MPTSFSLLLPFPTWERERGSRPRKFSRPSPMLGAVARLVSRCVEILLRCILCGRCPRPSNPQVLVETQQLHFMLGHPPQSPHFMLGRSRPLCSRLHCPFFYMSATKRLFAQSHSFACLERPREFKAARRSLCEQVCGLQKSVLDGGNAPMGNTSASRLARGAEQEANKHQSGEKHTQPPTLA